jgi:DNA (cytosine-5)-methyltransferase 1
MKRPKLLDLFCGAGGCAMGYYRAGFDVVGVDIKPQPRYPFEFVRGDALQPPFDLRRFDVIHASPPCQAYSVANNIHGRSDHPNLIEAVRKTLIESGKPYVIENVPGAPLHFPIRVCGLSLGCAVKRHRLFESNVFLFGTECPLGHRRNYLKVFGHSVGERVGGKGWVIVCGGGAPAVADCRRRADVSLARKAMGIDWMTRAELSQAIPPAYTEFIGRQLIRTLEAA